MKRINLIFSLSSLSVLLVTIERFSFTTKILLNPYNFLRLHEAFQMVAIILLTIVIPTLLLFEITENLTNIKKRDLYLILLFIVGVYFYSTGNGVHELASFTLNQYCDVKHLTGNLCNGLFFNDYYTGNTLFYIGGLFMVPALLLLEKARPNKNYSRKDLPITVVNAVIYAFAIFASAAFDPVWVETIYAIIITFFALFLFAKIKNKYLQYPVTTYTTLTYFLGTVFAVIVRLIR